MKKYLLLYLFSFFLLACSDDETDKPRIELHSISLNGGDEDYSNNLEALLPLSPGDYIDVAFLLYGNGADLKTFMVKNEDSNFNYTLFFEIDWISDEFSNISEGILGYKDDVRDTWVTVKLKVKAAKQEKSTVSFYLNSKALDCEGAVYHLDLETTTEPRVNEKE